MISALLLVFFGSLPPVPALNRWTHLFPPIRWWYLGGLIHNLTPAAWLSLYKTDGGRSDETIPLDLLIGPCEDDTVKQIHLSRGKKSAAWLKSKAANQRLGVMLHTLVPAVSLMADTFTAGALKRDANLLTHIDSAGRQCA